MGALTLACTLAAFGIRIGIATQFAAVGDPGNPHARLACVNRDLDDARDRIVASRELPCGTRVKIYLPRRHRSVVATVADRGPFGKRRDGSYRSQLDLAPATARAIRFNGYEPIIWFAYVGVVK